jgi:hypothetical protein
MNEWSLTSVPPTCLQGVDRENFIFIKRILVGMFQIRRPLRRPSIKKNYLKNTT